MIWIILWITIGLIFSWKSFQGMRQDWYNIFEEDFLDYDKRNSTRLIIGILILVGSLTGPFVISFSLLHPHCWYFKIPKK